MIEQHNLCLIPPKSFIIILQWIKWIPININKDIRSLQDKILT